jgi:hypothetical protein
MSALLHEQELVQRFAQGETRRQAALRAELWKRMLPLAGLAREVFGSPGVAVELRMPAKTADNDRVLKSAAAMADAAEKKKDVFVRLGLAEDSVDQLRASIQPLADALGGRVENQRRGIEATKQLRKQAARGRRVIRVINHILKPQLQDDETLRAAWESAKAPSDPGGGHSAKPDIAPADIVKVA